MNGDPKPEWPHRAITIGNSSSAARASARRLFATGQMGPENQRRCGQRRRNDSGKISAESAR